MSENGQKIPFAVEISRMIELLAAQIYPTPFALLRENVQNSFDAVLLRKFDHSLPNSKNYEGTINVTIQPKLVIVSDNGIGMSADDLRKHFWRAGSSSKNTSEARAAGVVGTFGIGAMANFGIAEELTVETESIRSGERTKCSAQKSTLSVTEDCISFESIAPTGSYGTTITAQVQPDKTINVPDAVNYISQFVAFLPIVVTVNGVMVSRRPIEESIPSLVKTWGETAESVDLGGGFKADVSVIGAVTGELRVSLNNIFYSGKELQGRMVLRQAGGPLRTFRSGFGLATASVSSAYQFGGVADFLFLQPTAGREALTTDSMQLLQQIVSRIDDYISPLLAKHPESNANAYFVNWAGARGRYDLCSQLRVRIEPGDSLPLLEVQKRSQIRPVLVYSGNDPDLIKLASEDRPMVLLTRAGTRRECELGFLRKFSKIEELSDEPRVLKQKADSELTSAERALCFRLASILATDYFLEAQIKLGTISHGLPILVTSRKTPIAITLDPGAATLMLILGLYEKEYLAFGHMTKDFVRTMIFPKVSDLVPSATRQGAEAFLKSINRTRELFEYESSDLESLASLWDDYLSGKLTFQQATTRADRVVVRSYQDVDSSAAAPVRDVVPDVIENDAALGAREPEHGPLPSIQRLDIATDRKLLTIAESDPALKEYRCFLAITDRIRDEKGDFFLQPHRTSIVWGGQKALFIFEHHSGNFGLYYDLQTQSLVSSQPGGGYFETCTIVMKNRIFIPIPPAIEAAFLPRQGERKRFEVRCDILYSEQKAAS